MGNEFATAEGIRVQITNEQMIQIRNLYKELSDEYKERLRILSNKQTVSASIREQYLKDYVRDLERDIQYLNNNLENTITSNMLKVAEAVVDDSLKLDKEMGFGGIMTKQFYIPQDVVATVTSGLLYDGKWTLSGAIWSTNQKQLNDINAVVAKGIAGNKSAYEIAKDLERYVNPNARKDWNWSKVYPNTNKKIDYNAQRLARTMVAHAYQESFVESTKDNPFIEKYRWLSSGSDRMCPICADRDGQIYDKDSLPMDHPNGMCTFEVVIERSYEEIGRALADWVNGEGDPELNAQIDNYADSLGLNVKPMTAGTEPVRKAEAGKVEEPVKAKEEFIPANAEEFESKWGISVNGIEGEAITNFDVALTYMQNKFGVDPKEYISKIDNSNPSNYRNYEAYYRFNDKCIYVNKNLAGNANNIDVISANTSVHEIMHGINTYLRMLEFNLGERKSALEIADEIVAKVYSENGYKLSSSTGLPSKKVISQTVTNYGSTNSMECLSDSAMLQYEKEVLGWGMINKDMSEKIVSEVKRRLEYDIEQQGNI